MVHATMRTFGYPDTVVRAYDHWCVQLRPQQATLGALVMICTEDARAFADVGAGAFAEMPRVVRDIEAALAQLFAYDRINYLMLMMVDPEVHFHVLPRYAEARTFEGAAFTDPGWPGPPELGHANAIDAAATARLIEQIRAAWPA